MYGSGICGSRALAIVDFTNPAACEWYSKKLEALLDMGVDCFKTDFGERIPTDAVYYDGSDPVKMHNYYTYLYNKVVFNVLKKKKGEKRGCSFCTFCNCRRTEVPGTLGR